MRLVLPCFSNCKRLKIEQGLSRLDGWGWRIPKLFIQRMSIGTRGKGRPKKMWLDKAQEDLKRHKAGMHEHHIIIYLYTIFKSGKQNYCINNVYCNFY